MAQQHWNITIHGRVQGVFFRASTREAAQSMGVKGFVRNEPDGTVYIEAEADSSTLEKFKDWCHEGSPQARVDKVEAEEGTLKNYEQFSIQY